MNVSSDLKGDFHLFPIVYIFEEVLEKAMLVISASI